MSGTHHDHETVTKPRKRKREAARRRLSIRQDRTALPGALAVCGFLQQYVDTPEPAK